MVYKSTATLVETMDDEYVAGQLRKLIQPQEHVCTETCDIVVPKIYIYAKDGKEVIHFQFQPKQPWMDDTTLVRRVHNIYVCKATRSVHRCHANCCMPKITNSEHCLVCPISGLQWDNSTEEIKSWKLAAKCAPAMTVDKSDPNIFLRNQDGTLSNSSATVNVHVHAQRKEIDELMHKLLFSFTRIRIELSKYVEGVKNANKEINRYKRKRSAERKPKNIATMSVIYLDMKFRRPNFLRIIDQVKTQKGPLTKRVADTIIGLYSCIVQHYKMNAPFRLFCCATIYIMKYGLQHDVWIVPKEPAFASILPEANVLGMFGVEKPLFTQTKNQILEILRDMLGKYDPKDVKRMITIS